MSGSNPSIASDGGGPGPNVPAPSQYVGPLAPYDPADSSGPIASVVERFRRRRWSPGDDDCGDDRETATVARYTVVLVPPGAAETLGHGRDDVGLKLYAGRDWECDLEYLEEAATIILEDTGVAVTLVERNSDLTYWTVHPRAGEH